MPRPQLYGTPLSHFTRKIRVLCAELAIDYEFVRTPGVLGAAAASYGDNPLLRVPALRHDGETLFESDHIARYLVARFDPADRLGVRSERVDAMNRLAVANGVMSNEVVLILAKRGGLDDANGGLYFRKLASAMEGGLAWLDGHCPPEGEAFGYSDVAAVCMWQHLQQYQLVPALDRYPRLAARVERFAARPSVADTTPAASLAEAAAAGWKPG